MIENQNRFAELVNGLDDRQKAIFIAKCTKSLIDDGLYDSPMFGPQAEQIKRLIEALAAETTDLAALEKSETATLLTVAQQDQAKVVLEEEKELEDWSTGKLRDHEDAWIAYANVGRARDGEAIIRWLDRIRQANWMHSSAPSQMEYVLTSKGDKWMQKFATLRQQYSQS